MNKAHLNGDMRRADGRKRRTRTNNDRAPGRMTGESIMRYVYLLLLSNGDITRYFASSNLAFRHDNVLCNPHTRYVRISGTRQHQPERVGLCFCMSIVLQPH